MSLGQQPGPHHTHSIEVRQVYERMLAGASVRARYVEVGADDRIHLLEKGAGAPVVLLHGTGNAAGFFLPLLNELEGVRALAPDFPGVGLSDPIALPRDRYRETVVAWVDRLLDALDLDTTTLLGHSGGFDVGIVLRAGSPGPGQAAGADRYAHVAGDQLPAADPAGRHARSGSAAVAIATQPEVGAAGPTVPYGLDDVVRVLEEAAFQVSGGEALAPDETGTASLRAGNVQFQVMVHVDEDAARATGDRVYGNLTFTGLNDGLQADAAVISAIAEGLSD